MVRSSSEAQPLECVAFILVKEGRVLVERRHIWKPVDPGALAIPGGHLEAGEQVEDALRRELREELEVAPLDARYVCTLLHQSEELRRIHYYVVTRWEGDVRAHEAAELLWLRREELGMLSLEIDRVAVAEYERPCGVLHSPSSNG